MNFQEAKKIKITDILSDLNYLPRRNYSNGNTSYLSPFRDEKTPSLFVHDEKNIFYDFSSGVGGSVIEFVCNLYHILPVDALRKIEEFSVSVSLPFPNKQAAIALRSNKACDYSDKLEVLRIDVIIEQALIHYISRRGINISIAKTYLQECHYTRGINQFYSLAFANDVNGYELNSHSSKTNKSFKSCHGRKYQTTIPGTDISLNVVHVFEGFFDFLSYLQHTLQTKPKEMCIILNSVAMLSNISGLLKTYSLINVYFDNDAAGEHAYNTLCNSHPNTINQAKLIYPGFKDYNLWLVNRK